MGTVFYLFFNSLISIVVFGLYIFYAKKYSQRMKYSKQKLFVWYILVVHVVFSFFFWILSQHESDALAYYNIFLSPEGWFYYLGMGSNFMRFISYPFGKLYISYFNTTMLFSIFSLISFFKLYGLFVENTFNKQNKLYWGIIVLLLMPTFHFYTSGISKDNLVFFLLVSFFTFIYNDEKFNYKYLLVFVFLLLLRPHILVFLAISYFAIKFIFANVSMSKKLGVIFLFTAIIVVLEPAISDKIRIDIFSLESIEKALDKVQSYGQHKVFGGSIIDSTNMNIIQKMLTYSYIPLIWKSDSLIKHIISLENFLLLLVLLKFLLKKGKIKFIKTSKVFTKVMLLYSILTWVLLSLTLYNLGLSTRQKYMYLPFFYFVIILHIRKEKLD